MKSLFLYLLFSLIISCKFEKNNEPTIDFNEIAQTRSQTDSLMISKIDSAKVPPSIKYEGKFKDGYIWNYKNEKNIVFITETGIFQDKKFKHEFEYGRDAELFCYSYNLNSNSLNWKIYDFVADCPVDIVAGFIDNTFKITDLDKNGIAEIWMMYKTGCHGDVSPSEMKIIMYEGSQKFAMRGENKVQFGIDDNGKPQFNGGNYMLDKNFENAPEVFKTYAKNLWSKNMIEKQNWK